MNILFLCKHNRFRSKVAEAIFNKLNKNKKNVARSRGLIKDIDVAQNVIDVLKEKNLALKSKKSIKLTKRDVKWADIIVNVADNAIIPKEYKKYLKNKKFLKWKISDTDQIDVGGIRKRVEIIEKKVGNLLVLLENEIMLT